MKKEVKIRVKGAANASLDDFVWFQGELKSLSDDSYDKLKKQILNLGFSEPVSVWVDGDQLKLLNGHQRVLTLKKMRDEGYKVPFIPYSAVEAANEEEAKRKVLSLTSTFGQLDPLGLAKFVHGTNIELPELRNDFQLAGLDLDTLPELKEVGVAGHTRLVGENPPIEDDDKVGELVHTTETFVKPGEIWKLGAHRLMCGDSTSIEHCRKLLKGGKAEMLFTDPPYGVNYDGGHFHSGDVNIKRAREKLAADDTTDIYEKFIKLIPDLVDGPCYTWFASTKALPVLGAIEAFGDLHAMIIWHKINATYGALNAQYKQRHEPCLYWKPKRCTLRWIGPTDECTVWDEKRDPKNVYHPTQKPIHLAERAIRNHDAKTVLDLFAGSGSTLIACENLGRSGFGMEIDPHYCSVIIERWNKATGKRAELVESPTAG